MSSKIDAVDLVLHILTEAACGDNDLLQISYFIADSLSEQAAKKLGRYIELDLFVDGNDS